LRYLQHGTIGTHEVVLATCATVYVMRILRRTPVPLTNEVNAVSTVLAKLRRREPLQDYEKPLAHPR